MTTNKQKKRATFSMAQRSKEFIACLMIALVLTMPFLAADVLADGQISSIKAKGKDNAEGVMRATDALIVEVLITGLSSNPSPSQVRLGSSTSFDSCSTTLNGSLCKARFPSAGEQNFDAKEMPFTVTLFDEANGTLDSKPSSILVDNKKPTISFAPLSSSNVGNEDITFSYTAQDTACDDASCSAKCSGIRKIEFFAIDNSFVETVNVNTRSCSYSSTFVKPSTSFPNGQTALLARVYDMVNSVSTTSSITFFTDNSGPVFIPTSLQILSKGIDIKHFKPAQSVPATVRINISEGSLNPNSVYANLIDLNPTDNSLKSSKGICTSLGNISTCSFSITLRLDVAGIKQLRFNASDTKGNTESATLARSFAVDNTGPTMLSLSSNGISIEGQAYAQPTATIVGALSEVGSGVSSQEMLLNVGGQKISASSCNATSCVWQNVFLGSGDVEVGIDDSSTDILGNAALSFSQVFTVNSNPPAIRSVIVSSVGGLTGASSQFVKIGDRIGIQANVSEDTQIASARADLSQFIPGASNVAGNCAYSDGNTFLCSWLSDPVENAVTGEAVITITDAAGNFASQSVDVQTYSASNDLDPNLWSSSVSCSPRTLDRQLGPLINQRAYCTVNLERRSSSGSLKTVSTTLTGCTGDQSSTLQNAELFNAQSGSSLPLIKLTLKKDQLSLDQLKTTCTLNIISLTNGAITSNPESETIPITLAFFNNPLGTLDAGVQFKIDEAMEATEGVWSIVDVLNDINNIAKNICRLFNMYYGIVGLLYGASQLLQIGKDTYCPPGAKDTFLFIPCQTLVAAATSVCVNKEGQELATDTAYYYGSQFCKFVNCKWAPWILGNIQKFSTDTINSLPGSTYFDGGLAAQMDPKSSLVTSVMFACIPGIIENLEKFRQIECLYADCLQTAVKDDNVPITVCENLKAQATCKYVTGELFALIPYTALFDKYVKMLKQALSDPFAFLGAAAGLYCWAACNAETPATSAIYKTCAGFKTASKIGTLLGEVKGIIDNGFFPPRRDDYCERLEKADDKGGKEEKGGLFG